MNIRPALVIIKDNRILTMQYRYGEKDVFNLPGGNVDFGEGLKDTLKREMMEELGLEVEVGDLLFVGEVHLKDKQTLHCVFKGEIIKGEPLLNPKETSALAVCWLDPEELSYVNLYPNVAEALKDKILVKGRTENGERKTGEKNEWFLGKIEQEWF